MDAAGDHADRGHPSRAAACPTARSTTSLSADTAGAETHRHRTPTPDARRQTPDAGRRTADTWTLRRPHRTLDTGRVARQAWTLVARTGHWTPDTAEDADRVTTAQPASGPSWATTPSDRALGRPTVFSWTAPAAPSAHAGSVVRPLLPRDSRRTTRQLLARSAEAERRLGALLSSDDFGSSVEREAHGQVLWRVQQRVVLWRAEVSMHAGRALTKSLRQ